MGCFFPTLIRRLHCKLQFSTSCVPPLVANPSGEENERHTMQSTQARFLKIKALVCQMVTESWTRVDQRENLTCITKSLSLCKKKIGLIVFFSSACRIWLLLQYRELPFAVFGKHIEGNEMLFFLRNSTICAIWARKHYQQWNSASFGLKRCLRLTWRYGQREICDQTFERRNNLFWLSVPLEFSSRNSLRKST